MSCRAVHFSLDADQVMALKSIDQDKRIDFVQETFEEELWSQDASRAQETDKAWDAIHRSLTDGNLGWFNGSFPHNSIILGGESLYEGDNYILSLKSPEQVKVIATALPSISRDKLRAGYDVIDPESYGMSLSDEDFEYTWEWFQNLRDFYRCAVTAGLAVLFTVDQ